MASSLLITTFLLFNSPKTYLLVTGDSPVILGNGGFNV